MVGPGPGAGVIREAGLHGVVADVAADPAEFGGVADDVVVAFVLPELAFASQDVVGLAGGIALQGVHDAGKGVVAALGGSCSR